MIYQMFIVNMMVEQQIFKIKFVCIVYVYYIYVDFDKVCEFLVDFGFMVVDDRGDIVYFKGYGIEFFVYCVIKGVENEFGGVGFVVEFLEDLEFVFKIFFKVILVYDFDVFGGGKCVIFRDFVDDFFFYLVYG